MGFKLAKSKVIECLNSGCVLYEKRGNINIKNLLSTGEISVEEVLEIIRRARGDNYSCSPHHFDANIEVHVIETIFSGRNWYIKWYFDEPDCVFISVHN